MRTTQPRPVRISKIRDPRQRWMGRSVFGMWRARCRNHGTINYFSDWESALEVSEYHLRQFHPKTLT